jgi:tetratricopeptide (TPR) repeat protein
VNWRGDGEATRTAAADGGNPRSIIAALSSANVCSAQGDEMKRAFTATRLSILLFMVIVFGCRSSGRADTSKAETQKQFGVRMAKMNLWREAMFRFKRAIEMNPDDAMAHNNLAVAYEANGDFDNAAKEYREALRLDRSNSYIQKNYSRFIEFTTRLEEAEAAEDRGRTDHDAAAAHAPQPPVIPPLLPPPTDTSVTTPEPIPPPEVSR